MKPDDVIRPFQEHFKIPNEVRDFLSDLLQREIETNYFSLGDNPRDPALSFAKGLLHIFEKLPLAQISDLDDSKLFASIRQLANITDEDVKFLHGLYRSPEWNLYFNTIRGYKDDIKYLENTVSRAAKGDNVYTERQELKEYKDALKNLEPPDTTPHLTRFWSDFLNCNVSFEIPQRLRFRHTHVLASPDAGKTVMLEFLAQQDMQTDAAIIVMAPKSTLIPNLAGRADPERLVLFSPEHPLALNIFDLGMRNKDEVAVSQTIELMLYIFDALLEAPATFTQRSLLSWCIRLLLRVPEATLSTLYALLGETTLPAKYDSCVETLSPAGQTFFRHQFGKKGRGGYQETKEELHRRLDLVFGMNPYIERMFSHPVTEVDMNRIMSQGKILLIDTSMDKNGIEGSSFIGRFFIGLLTLASRQRDTARPLRPVYFYLDELSLYVSEYLPKILDLVREARVGVTLAHQGLDQIRSIEPSVHRTGIKFVGACNEEDAKVMAGKFPGIKPETLQYLPAATFYFFAREFTQPMRVRANKEYLDALPQRSLPNVTQHGQHEQHDAPEEQSTPDPGTGVSKKW